MAPLRIGRRLWFLGGLGAVVVLWLGGPALLRRADFFRLRRVEFVGVNYLPPDVILESMSLPLDANVFDRFDDRLEAVRQLPGVESVSLERRLPGTLRVLVTETIPVALSPVEDQMVLVDIEGAVLPFDPSQSAPDLPIMAGPDSALASLVARVRTAAPRLFARVSFVDRVGEDAVLTLDAERIWFSLNAVPATIRAVEAVRADLIAKGRRFAELDGRFARQVVVRGSGA